MNIKSSVKRRRPRIVRSIRLHKDKDPENYYREQLMLYYPWRNEGKDLLGRSLSYKERYKQVEYIVNKNKKSYEHHSNVLDAAVDDIQHQNNEENSQPVAPNTQHINDQDFACKTKPRELFGCFDPSSSKEHSQSDIETCDMKLVPSLNEKQREFFYHVLHSVKTKDEPLRLFLSGGAGVGKSTVTNALYQALDRYLNTFPGENPDNIKVLTAAPTGKAAFNIKGNTLHSAFKIPVNRGYSYCTLDRDRLNTIRTQLRKLQVIFIDEISMVGSGIFNFLNLRLQQITDTNRPFGGLSIIAVGDLYQLQPVFDKWIFESSNDVYSAFATNIWK